VPKAMQNKKRAMIELHIKAHNRDLLERGHSDAIEQVQLSHSNLLGDPCGWPNHPEKLVPPCSRRPPRPYMITSAIYRAMYQACIREYCLGMVCFPLANVKVRIVWRPEATPNREE